MTQHIVVDGDTVEVPAMIDGAVITVTGGIALKGAGHATIGGKAVCLASEVKEQIFTFTYNKPPYENGAGEITLLPKVAEYVCSEQAVVVSGATIKLKVTTTTPAQGPDGALDEPGPGGEHDAALSMSNDFVTATATA